MKATGRSLLNDKVTRSRGDLTDDLVGFRLISSRELAVVICTT